MTLNPKNIEFEWFLATFGSKRVNCDEMDGDRPRLPGNRNCHRLSRVPRALARRFLVFFIMNDFGKFLFKTQRCKPTFSTPHNCSSVHAYRQCLNCPRGGCLRGLNPQLFSQFPNTLSNYALGGQLYTICIWFTSQFWSGSDRRKFDPQLIFHNSNTAYRVRHGNVPCHIINACSRSFEISKKITQKF